MDAWEILRIRGIPLRIHSSWFVIFFLFAWSTQGQVSNLTDSIIPFWFSWGVGFATSLVLFLSVLLHELGHSFMALHEGVKVKSITLFFLGGVANIERECDTAMGSFRVAIAGPIVSFFLSIIFFSSVRFFSIDNQVLSNLLFQIGSLNFVLGLFNLLPGLPLDGGVIIKSLVWHFTGSQRKGIKVATSTSRFLSLFAIFFGTFLCIQGAGLAGIWLIVLGWIGFGFAKSQNQTLLLQDILCELKIDQVKGRNYRILEKDLPLNRISQLCRSNRSNSCEPEWILVSNSGRWFGYITNEALKEIPVHGWDQYSIGDYSKPLTELPSISNKSALWEGVLEIDKSKDGRLLVVSSAGLPVGTLDRIDIGIAVLKKMGLTPPENIIELARNNNIYPLGLPLTQVVEGMIKSSMLNKVYRKGR